MNITTKKPIEEILSFLEPDEFKIAIFGCGVCATSCQTGGEKEVEELSTALQKNGKEVVFATVVETLCDERLTKRYIKDIVSGTLDVDAIYSMGCGAGNSVLSDLLEKPVYPTNNSLFTGSVKRLGIYEEKCSQCGNCITYKTAGICPVTRCPKGLINGPCGGSYSGKCEVDTTRDCAWVLIYNKLKKQGKLHYMLEYNKPKSFRTILKPQKIDKGK
ncbi:MAG: methylenetetrahydrofolate reductase C-terminal domain-containing protein [Cyanobacteriota bacterium]